MLALFGMWSSTILYGGTYYVSLASASAAQRHFSITLLMFLPLSTKFDLPRCPNRPSALRLMASSHVFLFAAIFAFLLTTASAVSLIITIPASNLLPNPHVLPPTTYATLTTLPSSSQKKHVLAAPLTRSSTFVFPELGASQAQQQQRRESYLLDIRSREYVFAPYRVDVADGRILGIWETFRGNPWDNRGAEKFVATADGGQNLDVVVEAKVVARKGFYEERSKCELDAVTYICIKSWCPFLLLSDAKLMSENNLVSPLGLFKNPMILLAVFALAVTFGMPKLLENSRS